jgi:hypothetical protein
MIKRKKKLREERRGVGQLAGTSMLCAKQFLGIVFLILIGLGINTQRINNRSGCIQ